MLIRDRFMGSGGCWLVALLLTSTALADEAKPQKPAPPENRPPVGQIPDIAIDEDASAQGKVGAQDPDGDTLAFALKRKPRHGTLSLDEETGRFEYRGHADYHGDDAFVVEVSDGKAHVTLHGKIVVRPANDAPTAQAATVSTREDVPAAVRLSATDKDGDALTFSVSKRPRSGSAKVVDAKAGLLHYTPGADFHGEDSFSASVSDGRASQDVEIKVKVVAENDAPVAQDASLEVLEDGTLSATLPASDVDGDALRYRIVTRARHGDVVLTDAGAAALQYKAHKDFHGEDAFTLEASDGKASARAEVKIRVTPVNDAPSAEALSITTQEDRALAAQLSARDVDGDALTYRLAERSRSGKVSVDAKTGALRYVPGANAYGKDSFKVSVSDGELSVSADVVVDVTPVNDAPVARVLELEVGEDQVGEGTLLVSDIDSDTLYYALKRAPQHGSVSLEGSKSGKLRYQPKADFHGDDAFSVDVSDGKLPAVAEVKVRVAPANDAPVVSGGAFRTREDEAVEVRATARDVDGDALTFRVKAQPKQGSVEILDKASGRFRYTPHANAFGQDAFTVEVSDGELAASARISLEITPLNDAPVTAPLALSVAEDESAAAVVQASDIDENPLRYRLVRAAKSGEVSLPDGGSGKLSYRPRKDFHGVDTFAVEVTDGLERVISEATVTVAARNDAPVVSGGAFRTREDEAVEVRATARDVDGDALTFRVKAQPKQGSVEILDKASGRFRYTPHANAFGQDAFTVEVSDGELAASARISLEITPLNDAPVTAPLALSVAEDESAAAVVQASDIDENPLRYRLVRAAKSGEVSLPDGGSGKLSYRPRKDFHGVDTFAVEVTDGRERVISEATVTVAARNDAPVTQAYALKTAEDTPARLRVSARDVDGDKLTFSLGARPRIGKVVVDEASGAVQYTPQPDKSGADAFTIEVSDGTATAVAAVEVEVLRVPDPPVVRDIVSATREDEAITFTLPAEDADGDKLTFRLLQAPARGTAKLEDGAAGTVLYTPHADVHGDDELRFEVSDGKHRVTGATRVRITAVNDTPTLEPLEVSMQEDRPVTAVLRGADVDGDELTFRVQTRPKQGVVRFSKKEPSRFTFEPAKDQEGTVTFTVVSFDGQLASAPAQVSVRIQGENDAPQVAPGQRFTTKEDEPYAGVLKASDGDGDALHYRVTRQGARGLVKIDDPGSGRFTYTPQRDYFGSDTFSFTVTDPDGLSTVGLMRVKIEEVDDPPVAIREYTDAPKYGRVTRKLKGFDPEGKAVSFRIVRQPPFGRVEMRDARSGEYLFVTDGDGSGTIEFQFVTNDGELDSAPAAVVVKVR